MSIDLEAALDRAAAAIRGASALLIGAGAGMGVDSGLPDFRGDAGFWKAYPPFRGRAFAEMSTPHWFRSDPELAWGFFGHRWNLYSSTPPHAGFAILRQWGEKLPHGYFVFTSNVDGHFQRAGFAEERVLERHGSIHYLQCAEGCSPEIWPAGELQIAVDMATIRTSSSLPRCPNCQSLARPNILMFNDYDWLTERCERQYSRYQGWLGEVEGKNIVAIEFGAGLAIPTVRHECEQRATTLIRVNPREAEIPSCVNGVSLPMSGLEAIQQIAARLTGLF
ncbi:SIR2 family NAD-dependent protein deacylase [Anatilimnocola floriformis]|uniref:SIR2 family NAD-dependent protein deacylase n=1 Tax=Anatilimnocola floriformis TaxID=2948575 RepID=UPI0020C1EEFE|nr:Sir2 family NAD-dependent protein deacetylase [Anatilimnocola floriformis]